MQKELLKNIFNKIKENSNINLSLIQQNSLKINLERQVGYICKDRHSEYKKYWLTLAFSDAQKYRLKKTVDNIVTRYNNLGEYDKTKIERWEDVIKTKTQLDNLLRGIIIGASLCIIAAVVTIFLIRRIRRKRRKKERELEELAQMYTEDE